MLVQLGDRVWALPGGVNIGVVRANERDLLLIDTGLNETAGKKALKAAREELGGEVVAILTTHGHADHFGANAAVVKRSGARVYAPRLDEAVLRYPHIQPAMLFAGADPLDSLRVPFLLGHASPVDEVIAPGPLQVAGLALEAIDLAGHSPGQVGYLVDDVLFCADVVLPETVLEKYRIPYLFGVTDHLAALERACSVPCRMVVPGHGPLLDPDGFAATVERNRTLVLAVADRVLELAKASASAAEILTGLLIGFGSPASDAASFYLLQPTVFAMLAHLHRQGVLRHEVGAGRSLWQTVQSG